MTVQHGPRKDVLDVRICKKCGGEHARSHDGCVTYSNTMFPQATEHAGVEIRRYVAMDAAVRAVGDAITGYDGSWDESELADRAVAALRRIGDA